MSQPAFPPPPTGLPPGWDAQWSAEHSAWYYVNLVTQESVWQFPTQSAYPAAAPVGPPPGGPGPQSGATPVGQAAEFYSATGGGELTHETSNPMPTQDGVNPVDHQIIPTGPPPGYDGTVATVPDPSAPLPPGAEAVPGAEGEEGQRGFFDAFRKRPQGAGPGGAGGGGASNLVQSGQQFLGTTAGKTALGVGAGVLLGGVLEHTMHKHAHVHTWNNNTGGGYSSGGGGGGGFGRGAGLFGAGALLGGLGGIGAASASGSNNNQQQFQPSAPSPGGGIFGGMFSGGGPSLHILSANYGGGDCTDKVRSQVQPNNTLVFDDKGDIHVFTRAYGDNWPGPNKSLVVLYQFGNGPMEVLITQQGGGHQAITAHDMNRGIRKGWVRGTGPVICAIWGIMENRMAPVPDSCLQQIANLNTWNATNEFFGFDGWVGHDKTAVVFYRNGPEILNFSLRNGASGRL